MFPGLRRLVALAGLVGLAGCAAGSGTSPNPITDGSAATDEAAVSALGNGPGGPPAYAPGPGSGTCTAACPGTDPADIGQLLGAALQEEYRALGLYRSVLEDFGPGTLPFATIAEAEARHLAALQQLLLRRDLTPAASAWPPSAFPSYATLPAACAAGVAAEQWDADFYTPYLQRTDLPPDVVNVFTSLQAASLQNHLPAFTLCR